MMRRLFLALGIWLASAGFFNAQAAFELGTGICETTTTTGTGTVNLAGAYTTSVDYLSFVSQITSGNTVPYTIESSDGKFEHGVGTFTDATPDTLSRTADWSSDGTGAELDLPAGTHIVCLQQGEEVLTGGVLALDVASIDVDGLTGLDTIDATSESTVEGAIDTLANLTSIQGRTVTLADAGADAIFGWDDSASAYENLTQAEVLAVIGDASTTAKGVSELATEAETEAKSDTGRTVTPSGLVDFALEDDAIGVIGSQLVTATGTYTPTSGTKYVKVTCTGPGGGGGGADASSSTTTEVGASGGGGGATGISWFDAAELGANAAVTIGAQGTAGGNTGTDGGAGGTTTFNPAGTGATCTANGGAAGDGGTVGASTAFGGVGAAGGTASGCDMNLTGGASDNGFMIGDFDASQGSAGGVSIWGAAGAGTVRSTAGANAGTAGGNYGGGGGGAALESTTTGAAGGLGGPSACLVEEFGDVP